MSSISMQVLKPAPIFVPTHIKKVAIVNRTAPSKDNKAMNIIEGVITGEGIYADREGSEECLTGLMNSLTRTDRFNVVRPGGTQLEGTGTGVLAPMMSWEQVEEICKNNDADAVIALEAFDSDSRITVNPVDARRRAPDGKNIVVTEHRADLRMDVKSGWRIYDPKNKVLIDEFKAVDDLGFNNQAPTPGDARAGLPIKREAIKKTGFHAGQQYGNRISPSWTRISRSYYAKANDRFKLARKKVKYNDWDGAAEIWKKEAMNNDKQIAGMACFNMAVAAEVDGNLDLALEWANRSYKEFNNFKGQTYATQIRARMNDVRRLEQQMDGN